MSIWMKPSGQSARSGGRDWRFALCASIVVAVASVASAQFNVGSLPLPKPEGDYETTYQGRSGSRPPWKDESGKTPFERAESLSHSFDPATNIITIGNVRDTDRVKHVWMRLEFKRSAKYTANDHGAAFNPAVWAVATSDDGDPNAVTSTGASWVYRGGRHLNLYQTWTITPQPSGEKIDISNIVDNAAGTLNRIWTKTQCELVVPAPSSIALMGMGVLVACRRRRAKA